MLRLSLFVILMLVVVAFAKPKPGLFDLSAEDFGFGRDSSEERGYYPRGGERNLFLFE